MLSRLLDREPEPPGADPPEKRLEAGAQEPFRPRRGEKRRAHPLRPVEQGEDQRPLEPDHASISASGRRTLRGGSGPEPIRRRSQISRSRFSDPESLGQASVGRGVRDDGAEGLEVEPVRREREPETEQHPTGCEALHGRAPGSRDPADRRGAAHAAQVEPPRERADETLDERRRGDGRRVGRAAPGSRDRAARSRLPRACAVRSLRCVQRPISVAPVVLVEVVEDRVGVQRDDPVDERRVTGEARLVPEFRRDCGELGERLFVDGPSVVRKARGAAALEQRRGEAGGLLTGTKPQAGNERPLVRVGPQRRKERLGLDGEAAACRRRRRAPRGRCPAQPSRSGPRGPRRGAAARAARRARPPPAKAASRATAGCCAATAPSARRRGSLASPSMPSLRNAFGSRSWLLSCAGLVAQDEHGAAQVVGEDPQCPGQYWPGAARRWGGAAP